MPPDVSTLLLLVLPGAVGGLVRGLMGISKHLASKNNTPIELMKFIFSLFVAMLVGALAGVLTENNWQVSLLAGYAGSDFLESLYKVRMLGLFK